MIGRPVFDLWHRIAPRDLSHSDVRIVWIDDAALKAYGAWPWPRARMAQLTETIAAAKPVVIGFDMIFAEADPANPTAFTALYPSLSVGAKAEIGALHTTDARFADVIGEQRVVLGRAGIDADFNPKAATTISAAPFAQPLPKSVFTRGAIITNIFELDFVATSHGLLNGTPDSDGVVRRVPAAGKIAGVDMPGFAFELARLARGEAAINPVIKGGVLTGFTLGGKMLPTDESGALQPRYGALPASLALSAVDLIEHRGNPALLSGKIVIVALSGAGTADVVTLPGGDQEYGAMIHAAATDAVLGADLLTRPYWSWMVEGAIAALLVGLAVHYLPLGRLSSIAVGAGTAIVCVSGASFAAFANEGWLIDPLSPVVLAAATSATILLMLFAKNRSDLQNQRLIFAKADGELSAARAIQLGMLPPRDSLNGFHPRIAVDALIEPARSIGGDFYDVIALDDHRIIFLVGDVTGKGVPAALFMALSKALAASVLLRDGDDLARAMCRLNTEIARDNREDMFVTMLIGLFDTRDGRLELCNAGHENPYLIAGGAVTLLTPEGGPPLSVAPDFPYEGSLITLRAGDTIIVTSDGVNEAQNGAGDFFGADRLEAILKTTQTHICDTVLHEVRTFENGAEASDDLTILTLTYLT